MKIEIKAVDNLFFKDAKPFNLGEESWANGVFPPPPSAYRGLLMSAYMNEKKIDVSEINKKENQFVVNSCGIVIDGLSYYPIPADLYNLDENKDDFAYHLDLVENTISSNASTSHLLTYSGGKKLQNIVGESLVSSKMLNDYLEGTNDEVDYESIDTLITYEPKIGIGRDYSTQITKEGQLYRVNMMIPKSSEDTIDDKTISFYLDALVPEDFLKEGVIRFGAEGKVIRFFQNESILNPVLPEIRSKRFKMFLATDTVFEQGWLPAWIKNDNLQGTVTIDNKSHNIRLIACAINKRKRIGGFDMQLGAPKPMYSFVPQGSVYYFETDSVESAKIISKALHGKCMAEMDMAKNGFGLAYFGNLKNKA